MATLHIKTVQSLDTPELALYLTLRRVDEHERAGVLVATNVKVVRRLLASRFAVASALLTPAWLEKLEPQLRARPEKEICVHVGEQRPTRPPTPRSASARSRPANTRRHCTRC